MTENNYQHWRDGIVAPDGGDSLHIPGWQDNLVAPNVGDSLPDVESDWKDGIEEKGL